MVFCFIKPSILQECSLWNGLVSGIYQYHIFDFDPNISQFDVCVPFLLHSIAFMTFEGACSRGAVEPVPGGERDHPT